MIHTYNAPVMPLGADNGRQQMHPGKALIAEVDQQLHALRLSDSLFRILELEALLKSYADQFKMLVNFDSIGFKQKEEDIDLVIGEPQRHHINYNLVLSDKSLGQLAFSRAKPFKKPEIEQVENSLSYLVHPLRNALLYYKAKQSASRDVLTGVGNRTLMDSAISREISRTKRHKENFSIMVVDCDHFKEVNDTHGHLAGDSALKAIAGVLLEAVRECDLVFRFGGDEFVIGLNNTDLDGAIAVAERIREKTAALTISGTDIKSPLSVTVGLAQLQPEDDFGSLFERADQALYFAKEKGRNRISVAKQGS